MTVPVEGELDDSKYRLRTQLADGTIGAYRYDASLNADNGAVFVEFPEAGVRVKYTLEDMVRDAHATFIEEENDD